LLGADVVSMSTNRLCAWTVMRYLLGPNTEKASTMPLDSRAPQLAGVPPSGRSSSVGPSSADWSIFRTAETVSLANQ
jgi:hypothetical protein